MKNVTRYKLLLKFYNKGQIVWQASFVKNDSCIFSPEEIDIITERYGIKNYEYFSVEILEQWNEFVD